MIRILLGGSPCTHWSIAQSKNRETEPSGEGWELFKNYLIAKEKFRPDIFLYENNKSAAPAIKNQISKELGVDLMYINSALVSAQNRQRFYCFNWTVEQPEDRGIILQDIMTDEDYAEYNGGTFERTNPDLKNRYNTSYQIGKTGKSGGQAVRVYDIHGKAVALKSQSGGGGARTGLYLVNGSVKSLSRYGAEKLQTLPKDYTKDVSQSKAISLLGNGWTAEVIIHILRGALRHIPRDEGIEVLSMYDGIATGRYCLDKLGFNNVRYYAYEIDKYAKQVAMNNYTDIIQCGDAFRVRDDDWGHAVMNNPVNCS